MKVKYVIALDIGTSSCRAFLYDQYGQVMNSYAYEYHSDFPKPGYVEQDPNTWKHAVLSVLTEVSQYMCESGYRAEGIVVTSQRSSLIPMGQDGAPLYNAIMWQDKRTVGQCDRLVKEYGLENLYMLTGLRVNPYFVLPKILWLKENRPDVFWKSNKFIGVQDYVIYILTGDYITDTTQACRTMMMNIKEFVWDKHLLEIAGIEEERLPKLVFPGEKVGTLTKEVSEITGLPAGLPIVASGGDQQNAAVGLGVIESGIAEANSGTGSFVLAHTDKPVLDKSCRVLLQSSAVPGKWVIEAGIFNTGAIYRWFKEQFCKDLKSEHNAYELMNDEALKSPPGARGVLLLPHFEGSAAPYWNPKAKGVFFNLSLANNRGDLCRAILEGVAMEIFDNLKLIQDSVGLLREVEVAGGMTRGDLFCQIQADCYSVPVKRYSNSEATSLGAVMIGAEALGVYRDFEEAFNSMKDCTAKLFLPNEENAKLYKEVLLPAKHKLYETLANNEVYDWFSNLEM